MFKRILLLHYSIALFLFTTVISAQEQENPKQMQIIVNEEEAIKLERENDLSEATQIQDKAIGYLEKLQCRLFPDYSSSAKIHDGLSEDDGLLIHRNIGMEGDSPDKPLNVAEMFQSMAFEADSIIIGVVVNKTSFINESDDFIFTNYEIKITDILKNNVFSIGKKNKLSVLMPGGIVLLNGCLVKAIDDHYLPLYRGLKYALFLKYNRQAKIYTPLNSKSCYVMGSDKVKKLTKENFPLEKAFHQKYGMSNSKDAKPDSIDSEQFLSLINSAIIASKAQAVN